MGKQDIGETVTECAIRETEEETGVLVEVTGIHHLRTQPQVFGDVGDLPALGHQIDPSQGGRCGVSWHGTGAARPMGEAAMA